MEFILADLLLPEVSQLMLHPGWLVGFKVESQGSNFSAQLSQKEVESLLDKNELVLHDLRKVAKRTRYNMELFSQFYSENYETYLKDIKNIQTILGDIQDSFVLCEFPNNIFDKNILNKMPAFSNILQENRYHKWQEWEGLQQKFFNSEIRKNFHLTILDPSIIQSSPQESDKGIEEIVSTNVSD